MNIFKIMLVSMLAACFIFGCAASKDVIATKKTFYDKSFNARGDSNANGPSNSSDSAE